MNSSPELQQPRLLPTLIPIKIQCGCGQKYAFEVAPGGERMAYAVQCPLCGRDGTALANHVLAQHLTAPDPAASRLRISEPDLPPQAPPAASPIPVRPTQRRALAATVGKTWLKLAIFGAVAVVLLVAAGTVFVRWHSRQSNPANSGPVANDGYPRTLKELNASYVEPPAGQNAAAFYSQGFDALQIDNVRPSNVPFLGKGTLPSLGAPLPVFMKALSISAITANKAALQFFARGAEFDQCRYPVDLTAGFETIFPHLIKVKSAVQLVALSEMIDLEKHDLKQAAKDELTALALAGSLETEPALISQSVRAANVDVAVRAWERTANRLSLPGESLTELQKAFQKLEESDARGEGFSRGLASERANWIALFGTPQKLLELVSAPGVMDMPAARRERLVARLQKSGNLKEELLGIESSFQQLLAARKARLPDRLKAVNAVCQRAGEDEKHLVLQVLLPGLTDAAAKEAGCLASLRLGLTGVALEQFRAAHDNRYPASLSQLTPQYLPAIPSDPFDGEPLRYLAKDLGYTLYSIGSDLKNDSGRRMNGKDGDIVFAVISPPEPGKNSK
jgi:hypothetical protein